MVMNALRPDANGWRVHSKLRRRARDGNSKTAAEFQPYDSSIGNRAASVK
jgi:hypothetical protein